jgi:chaperonin GroES
MKLQPIGNKIIVQPEARAQRTVGGLYIPQNANENPIVKGVVIAVGSGAIGADNSIKPMTVKIGDNVLFDKRSGQTLKDDSVEICLISENDVFGIILDQ